MRKWVSWPGGSCRLRPIESKLLAMLASASSTVRRERLIDAAWGDDIDGGPDNASRAVYVHICHLRKRLAAAGFPGLIKNVWGIGYELQLAA